MPWPEGTRPTSTSCTIREPSTAKTPSSRQRRGFRGQQGFYSTALWLRAAFAGLHYEIRHAIADGNLVAVNSTMNGRRHAPWAVYTDSGEVNTVFPPTNKTFTVTQPRSTGQLGVFRGVST